MTPRSVHPTAASCPTAATWTGPTQHPSGRADQIAARREELVRLGAEEVLLAGEARVPVRRGVGGGSVGGHRGQASARRGTPESGCTPEDLRHTLAVVRTLLHTVARLNREAFSDRTFQNTAAELLRLIDGAPKRDLQGD